MLEGVITFLDILLAPLILADRSDPSESLRSFRLKARAEGTAVSLGFFGRLAVIPSCPLGGCAGGRSIALWLDKS